MVLIGLICLFALGYSTFLGSIIFDIHFDFNSLFAPILFFGSIFVLATAFFTIRLCKKIFTANKELTKQASFDQMTGLPNRRFIEKKLGRMLFSAQRSESSFAVVIIDILDFKRVNNSFGHNNGDAILSQAASRLLNTTPNGSTVGRIGGDDFVVLLEGVSPKDAIHIIQNLRNALLAPYSINETQFVLDTSFGIYFGNGDETSPNTAIAKANMAMRRSKQRGKSRIAVYSDTLEEHTEDILQLENELRDGIKNNEFILYYQPQYALQPELTLTGFEALVRWQHPTKGLLSPIHFIPAAEHTGIIMELDRYILRLACETWSNWRSELSIPNDVHLSINISACHIEAPTLINFIRTTLDTNNVPTLSIILELTESAIVSDPALAAMKLETLRSSDIKVALDDFGTGYSSLVYLTNFPTYSLKIDRCFIKGIEHDGKASQIVQSIIDLAHGLNMTVLAEGVEIEEQLAILTAMQCDQAQGYYLNRPMPEADAFTLLKEHCQPS